MSSVETYLIRVYSLLSKNEILDNLLTFFFSLGHDILKNKTMLDSNNFHCVWTKIKNKNLLLCSIIKKVRGLINVDRILGFGGEQTI